MFATEVVAEDHVPPEIEAVKVVVPLEQMEVVPVIVAAVGAAVTVTVLVAVAFEQPPVPEIVYVIVAVPAATPVITPLASILAIVISELDQVPPLTLELKVVVDPTQTA